MIQKLLVIRFSSIGDIVLTSPLMRCVKSQLGAEIHYLTKPQFRPLLEGNPNVDVIHSYDKETVSEVLANLRDQGFDWVADLHHNLRSLKVKRALSRPGKSFPKLNIEKWLMVNFKYNALPDVHIVDRYLASVAELGVVNDGLGLEHHIPDNEPDPLQKEGLTRPYVAIAVGAAHRTKCLEDWQIAELIDHIGGTIVLLGGPDEAGRAEQILATAKSPAINLCGKLSLNGSAWVVKDAAVLISPDTAMMHLAAAYRTPLISVWGNTIPEFGMYPYYGNEQGIHQNFEIGGLKCRPCSKIGYDVCPKGHFKCIRELDLDQISHLARAWRVRFGLGNDENTGS